MLNKNFLIPVITALYTIVLVALYAWYFPFIIDSFEPTPYVVYLIINYVVVFPNVIVCGFFYYFSIKAIKGDVYSAKINKMLNLSIYFVGISLIVFSALTVLMIVQNMLISFVPNLVCILLGQCLFIFLLFLKRHIKEGLKID